MQISKEKNYYSVSHEKFPAIILYAKKKTKATDQPTKDYFLLDQKKSPSRHRGTRIKLNTRHNVRMQISYVTTF